MTQSRSMRSFSPFALTGTQLNYLQRIRLGARGRTSGRGDRPSPTRSYLLATGYLDPLPIGVTVTPRGRTALLCRQP